MGYIFAGMTFMVGDTVEFDCSRIKAKAKGFVIKTHAGANNNGGAGKYYNDSIDVTLFKKIPVSFGYAGIANCWFSGEVGLTLEKVSVTRVLLTEKDKSDDFKWE